MRKTVLASGAIAVLSACKPVTDDARGVEHDETLLSVAASGQAESTPDRAEFQAGIETWAGSAKAASAANAEKIREIVTALRELGIDDDDIQTRAVSVQRIDYGDRRGQFQAGNVVNVTLDQAERASEAVAAVTEAGANIVSGPNLSMTDPEATANLAYAEAFKAARRRAEAYAEAAGMEISRVLYIRDAGGTQGSTWLRAADQMAVNVEEAAQARPVSRTEAAPVAPPPPPPPPPGVMTGTTTSNVNIQVDFALRPK